MPTSPYEYAIMTRLALEARDFTGLRWHFSVAEALAKTPMAFDPYSGRVSISDPVMIRRRGDVLELMDMDAYVWRAV